MEEDTIKPENGRERLWNWSNILRKLAVTVKIKTHL